MISRLLQALFRADSAENSQYWTHSSSLTIISTASNPTTHKIFDYSINFAPILLDIVFIPLCTICIGLLAYWRFKRGASSFGVSSRASEPECDISVHNAGPLVSGKQACADSDAKTTQNMTRNTCDLMYLGVERRSHSPSMESDHSRGSTRVASDNEAPSNLNTRSPVEEDPSHAVPHVHVGRSKSSPTSPQQPSPTISISSAQSELSVMKSLWRLLQLVLVELRTMRLQEATYYDQGQTKQVWVWGNLDLQYGNTIILCSPDANAA